MQLGWESFDHLDMASTVLRAGARREIEDGCRSVVIGVDALKARAPGIDIASPAAAPKITRRMERLMTTIE